VAGSGEPTLRRINPRHCTETLTVAPYDTAGTWLGSWGADVAAPRCQVEHTRQVIVVDGGVKAVTVMTARVPPTLVGDVADLFPPDSRVTYRGDTSWVLTSRRILNQGQLVYLEVTTGDRPSGFGGGWVVDVIVHDGPGRDARGNPTPPQDRPIGGCVITAGASGERTSSEPLDRDEAAVTAATLQAPPAETIRSTATLTVLGDSPLAGNYSVVGDPTYLPTRTEIALRRTP